MAGWVEIDSNAPSVAVRYDRAPRLIAQNIVKVFRSIGAQLQRAVIRDKLSAGGQHTGQQALARRTGTLQRAIFYQIRLTSGAAGSDAVLVLGADRHKAAYAAAQEFGATIRAKRSAHLAIPLTPALTGRGVARVSVREFIANPESLGFVREFVNKAKTVILGVKGSGKSQTVEPVFALKTQVVLPERSYLRATVAERRQWILEQLGADVADGVAEGA